MAKIGKHRNTTKIGKHRDRRQHFKSTCALVFGLMIVVALAWHVVTSARTVKIDGDGMFTRVDNKQYYVLMDKQKTLIKIPVTFDKYGVEKNGRYYDSSDLFIYHTLLENHITVDRLVTNDGYLVGWTMHVSKTNK